MHFLDISRNSSLFLNIALQKCGTVLETTVKNSENDKGKIAPVIYQEIFKEQMYFNLESRRKLYLNNFQIPKMCCQEDRTKLFSISAVVGQCAKITAREIYRERIFC